MAKKKKSGKKSGTWIDYAKLRSALDAGVILSDHEIEWKERGGQIICRCPFHEDRRASFSFNCEKRVWQCFGCKLSGNVLDLAVRLRGGDPEDAPSFREHAIEIQSHYAPEIPLRTTEKPQEKRKSTKAVSVAKSSRPPAEANSEPSEKLPVVINPELPFELTDLVHDHPYLIDRGFESEVMKHFGVGACDRGLMKDRIAIPVRNEDNLLVGYAGRAIDDERISDDFPKYRFPGERTVDGKTHRFAKSHLLYNFENVSPSDHLIIVEGFASVWWLHQNGLQNIVAVMGSSLSDEQAELIYQQMNEHAIITVVPDGNDAGDHLGREVMTKLGARGNWWLRWFHLPRNEQPTDIDEGFFFEELRTFVLI